MEAITAELFKITSLKTNNFLIVDPLNQAGDDRGGLVASATRVFLRGDDAVGGFNLTNLGNPYRLGTNNGGATNFFQHDSLISDLRSQKVYLLGNGTTPIGVNGGTATTLLELDGTNGAVVGAPITLSSSIALGSGGLYTANVGLFSGWGRVVIHNGTNAYSIDPATGTVTDLGAMARPVRAVSESWAYWGVAEYWGGSVKLVYGRDAQAIVRATVPSGATEVVGAFANLNDLANFTVVPTRSRWIFHMETINQFTNYINYGGETLGYADATFIYQAPPATIISQPQSLTVTVGANATFNVAVMAATAVSYQWKSNGVALLNETNASLTVTNAQLLNSGDVFAVTVQDGGAPIVSANATLTVLPNASPTLTVPGPITVLEDAGSQTNLVTGITAGAAHETNQTLTVTATSDNPALTGPLAVSYAAGTATLRYTNVANAYGSALITVTVTDNGGVTSGGVDTTSRSYLLTVTPVNDAPSAVAATGNVVVLEDASPVTVAGFLSAISAGPGEMQVLSLSVANNNSALFLAPPAISLSTGDLTFTPAANAFGSAIVTYILSDDGGTANGGVDKATNTFTITVTPVNDAPTLTVGVTTLNVLTNAGALTTNLTLVATVGPANEVGSQTITNLSVSNDNAALFSVQPTLALNGNLSFTVAGNVVGTAILSIRAQDNGGTLNGGVNLSPIVNVTINVSGPNQVPTFTLATSNVVVAEDSGAASVSAFLTSLSAGEVTQTVTNLTTSNNNSNLFSAQPVIVGGTLTFTPAADANGVATVTVRATDNGIAPATGTQTFTITVTAVNDAPSFTLPSGGAAVSGFSLWAWGQNNAWQLGDGAQTLPIATPEQIGTATDWQSVAAGSQYSVAVKSDGTLWGWGKNSSGQLGDGTTTTITSPMQIGTATDWKAVWAVLSQTFAIKTDGTLWAWGANGFGQLGDGTTTPQLSPVQIGTANNWKSMAPGSYHTLGLRADGTLWAWGDNSSGQLGDGTTTAHISPAQVGTATD